MNAKEVVSTVMTSSLITVNVKESLLNVKNIFEKNRIRHIPVTDESKKLIGMLSLTDIQRISIGGAFGGDPETVNSAILEMMTIEQIMKKNPHTVQRTQTVREVAKILTKEEYHALPVLDGDQLVGIITTTDVIRYLLEKCKEPVDGCC